jgi:hypothetical protein
MTMFTEGNWSDEEVGQIDELVKFVDPLNQSAGDFSYDNDWQIISVARRPASLSIVDVALSRVDDGKRLTLAMMADETNQKPWVSNESSLTDQVWILSVLLMEYVGIFGIDDFENDQTIQIITGRDVYSLKPPNWI